MTETKKIVITGTHITPAIELIRQLKNDRDYYWDIYYLGRRYNSSVQDEVSIESKIIPKYNVKFHGILCGKFDRRWLPNTLKGLPQIFSGLKDSYLYLKKIHPHLVVSFGGYVSVPVIFSAYLHQIPSLTHEQTRTLSLSTRINSLFCQKVALSFPFSGLSDKYVVTGNLIRQEIFSKSSKKYHFLKSKLKKFPLIFLTAGNQGSHHLNKTLEALLPTLTKKFTIIHQTGQNDFPYFQQLKFPNYHVAPYIDSVDIGWILNNASLVISRAGANTTQEIAALKLKSILIPLPLSQQDEQLKNALWLHRQLPHHNLIIKDQQLDQNNLLSAITKLIHKKKLVTPKTNFSNSKLLKLIKRL